MTAVFSRLSVGLGAIQVGMQQQQEAAAQAARAAVQCLPSLANLSEFAEVAPPRTPSSTNETDKEAIDPQQQEKGAAGAAGDAAANAASGPDSSNPEKPEEESLRVDRRLWGSLPGAVLRLGFGVRAALDRLTHDSFASLYIHSLQVALPSPAHLLGLPAVPATKRLLPVTAVRPTLTSEAFYSICCLADAPLSPCLSLDLILTVKGVKQPPQSLHLRHTHVHRRASAGTFAAPASLSVGPRGTGAHAGIGGFFAYPLPLSPNYNTNASPSVAAAVAAAAPATAAAIEGMAAAGMNQDITHGSFRIAAPLLRLEVLKRPRKLDDAAPSVRQVARSLSPRILVSPPESPRSPPAAGTPPSSGRGKDSNKLKETQRKESDCVLEILLKALQIDFISERSSTHSPHPHHHHRLHSASGAGVGTGGRVGLGSVLREARAAAHAAEGSGASSPLTLNSDEKTTIPVEPFRVVLSLRDCIIRGEDGSCLLQNASCIPKLFSGEFAAGGGAQAAATGMNRRASIYGGAPQQSAGGNAHGAQGPSQSGLPRRFQQRARVCVQQAGAMLQDPLLQSLVWVSDGMIFVSADVAYLRVQLQVLQAISLYSWGMSLLGSLRQFKHFRLQFPAISFACCFSTASWLAPMGVSPQDLLRVQQRRLENLSPTTAERLKQEVDTEQLAIENSLLQHHRGLGVMSVLYPSVPVPALAPEEWHGYLPLQLPGVARSLSIQQVLRVIEAEVSAIDAAAAIQAASDAAVAPPPWRLRTHDLFQHPSLLLGNLSSLPLVRLYSFMPFLFFLALMQQPTYVHAHKCQYPYKVQKCFDRAFIIFLLKE